MKSKKAKTSAIQMSGDAVSVSFSGDAAQTFMRNLQAAWNHGEDLIVDISWGESIADDGGGGGGSELEDNVRDLIKQGKYGEALMAIKRYYPVIDRIGDDYASVSFTDEKGGGLTQNSSVKVDGEWTFYCSMKLPKSFFDAFAAGTLPAFGDLVRLIYHEFVHVEQFLGLNGTPNMDGDNNKAEREFVATWKAIMEPTLPQISEYARILWTRTAITDKVKEPSSGRTIGDYYFRMSEEKQKQYRWIYRILQLSIRFE